MVEEVPETLNCSISVCQYIMLLFVKLLYM